MTDELTRLKELAERLRATRPLEITKTDDTILYVQESHSIRQEASAAILSLLAKLEKAEEALRPFAEYCNGRTSDLFPDDQNITLGSPMARRQLTIGDCRIAARALKSNPMT